MPNTIKWNIWDYLKDDECLRTDCWDEEYMIIWNWKFWIPIPYEWWSIGWYVAWDWIEISGSTISIDNKIMWLINKIKTLEERIQKLEDSNPEEVKFLTVDMDWTEVIVEDIFITPDTDITWTWLSWKPAWLFDAYVNDWKAIIVSDKAENWRIRLRLSKPYWSD